MNRLKGQGGEGPEGIPPVGRETIGNRGSYPLTARVYLLLSLGEGASGQEDRPGQGPSGQGPGPPEGRV